VRTIASAVETTVVMLCDVEAAKQPTENPEAISPRFTLV